MFSLSAVSAGTTRLFSSAGRLVHTGLLGYRAPLRQSVQRVAVLVHLLEGAGDVVHVGARSEEHALFEPDALLAADEVAVRAADPAVVQSGGGAGRYGPKALLRNIGWCGSENP